MALNQAAQVETLIDRLQELERRIEGLERGGMFVASNVQSVKLFVQSTTPSGGKTDDVWVSTGGSGAVYRYNGTSWSLIAS